MHILIQYQKTDGVIKGIWQADPTTMLLSQVTAGDPLVDYLVEETELPATTLLADYYVVDGTLTAKALLTITATPSPFPADGMTVCQLSVEPFQACTLVVGQTPQHLTMDDQVLELTTDTPRTFTVALAPMTTCKANPIQVEATVVQETQAEDRETEEADAQDGVSPTHE